MKCFLPFALVMSLIIAFSLVPRNSEADESETAPSSAEFEDKIVTVYIDGPEKRAGLILSDVEIVNIAGRPILVGTGVHTQHERNWTGGVRVGVGWDRVHMYYAMTDEQYEEKVDQYRQRQQAPQSLEY